MKFSNVNLFREENLLFEAEHIKVAPGLMSLFRPETVLFFKGKSYDGTWEGKASLVKSDTDSRVQIAGADAVLSGIQIKKISAIQTSPDYDISGILNGNITHNSSEASEKTTDTKFVISDCEIELSMSDSKLGLLAPVLKSKKFIFKTINADITIDNNRKLQIKECIAKGDQANVDLTGSIDLKTPVEKSVLNLTGSISPHPSFIADLGSAAALIFREGSFPLRIRGTFKNPKL